MKKTLLPLVILAGMTLSAVAGDSGDALRKQFADLEKQINSNRAALKSLYEKRDALSKRLRDVRRVEIERQAAEKKNAPRPSARLSQPRKSPWTMTPASGRNWPSARRQRPLKPGPRHGNSRTPRSKSRPSQPPRSLARRRRLQNKRQASPLPRNPVPRKRPRPKSAPRSVRRRINH